MFEFAYNFYGGSILDRIKNFAPRPNIRYTKTKFKKYTLCPVSLSNQSMHGPIAVTVKWLC